MIDRKEYYRAWSLKNRARLRAKEAKWRAEHPEAVKKSMAKFRASVKGQLLIKRSNARASQKSVIKKVASKYYINRWMKRDVLALHARGKPVAVIVSRMGILQSTVEAIIAEAGK